MLLILLIPPPSLSVTNPVPGDIVGKDDAFTRSEPLCKCWHNLKIGDIILIKLFKLKDPLGEGSWEPKRAC